MNVRCTSPRRWQFTLRTLLAIVAACAVLLSLLTPYVRYEFRRHATRQALRGIEATGADVQDVGLFFWSIYGIDLRGLSLDESSFERLSQHLQVLKAVGCEVEIYVDCGQLSSERLDKLKSASGTIRTEERDVP